MKKCKDCGETKPLTEFYKGRRMMDGHLNSCKSCRKQYMAQRRIISPDAMREIERRRNQKDERRAYARKRNERYQKNNPIIRKAHIKLGNAIRDGRVERATRCSQCESEEHLQAHHPDYEKPLEVIWLCATCHARLHRDIRMVSSHPEYKRYKE